MVVLLAFSFLTSSSMPGESLHIRSRNIEWCPSQNQTELLFLDDNRVARERKS